ncbi:MAG: acyl-CoA thioesterase [Lentisphaeria bacterium]|nr:acyl-CoA thioesterase [Lentisphaeria bacterium]
METFTVVRPEHLNSAGNLFGGQLLSWVDEYSWLAATRDFPLCAFVTRAMTDVAFRQQVPSGAIVRFTMTLEHVGVTSVTYGVSVDATPVGRAVAEPVFNTSVVLVNIDQNGAKSPIPLCPQMRDMWR